jgi:hypothetical protein
MWGVQVRHDPPTPHMGTPLLPPPKTLYQAVSAVRQGYFYTYNFIPLHRVKNSRIGVTLQQGVQPLVSSPYCLRYLVEAGFPEVQNNIAAFQSAQEIISNTCLVMSMNMVQRPYTYPSRLYRLTQKLDAYLSDRPDEMERYHLLGVTGYDAETFQRISSKLLWSIGAAETSLNPQEQQVLLQMLIDVSQAALKEKLQKNLNKP